jgi:DNA replication and repair protein RecF
MRILNHRNHLLKNIKHSGTSQNNETELEVWTQKIAQYAAMITRYRGEYVERLKEFVPEFYIGLSSGKEGISLTYVSQINKYSKDFEAFRNYEQCEKLYGEIYSKGVREEINYGTTLYGPHRDDLYVAIDGKNSKSIASQGQQRSAVLALKLAEGEISRIANGEYPVFLLDDILSELDRSRQEFIFKNLENRQVIVTCCNKELFEGMNVSNVVEVANGEFALT